MWKWKIYSELYLSFLEIFWNDCVIHLKVVLCFNEYCKRFIVYLRQKFWSSDRAIDKYFHNCISRYLNNFKFRLNILWSCISTVLDSDILKLDDESFAVGLWITIIKAYFYKVSARPLSLTNLKSVISFYILDIVRKACAVVQLSDQPKR